METWDAKTVEGFGQEWSTYDQSELSVQDAENVFQAYFSVFPWQLVSGSATGFDLGCGSGRWSRFIAPRVGHLHLLDASDLALTVAKRNLDGHQNVSFHHARAGALPFKTGTMDFGFSLGVLHHVPDTEGALADCARVLKPGAPFLVYLYYDLDNKPAWFRALWRASDVCRRAICRLPFRVRVAVTTTIAALVYWPTARLAKLLEAAGRDVSNIPLSSYRSLSFYTMKTDALDRFGTRLEKRFTKDQVRSLLVNSGFREVQFREDVPYWVAVGLRS